MCRSPTNDPSPPPKPGLTAGLFLAWTPRDPDAGPFRAPMPRHLPGEYFSPKPRPIERKIILRRPARFLGEIFPETRR
jgi:hypothetical protein